MARSTARSSYHFLTLVLALALLLSLPIAIRASWFPPGAMFVDGDGPEEVGVFTSLAVVNGHPAISYYDFGNDNLKYARATDTTGTSWISMTVDGSGDVQGYTSMQVLSTTPPVPAISYRSSSVWGEALMYARATDINGTNWVTTTVVSGSGDATWNTSLAIVDGRPAIGYYDQGYGLRYVRANDTTGSSWGTPVTVDDSGDVGVDASLAIVNGNPAISYLDQDYYDLMYIRATDANGTTWGPSIAVETDLNVGGFTSLAVIAGNPAISYYDYTNTALKYIRANDPNMLTIEKVEARPMLETMGGWLAAFVLLAMGVTGLLCLRHRLAG